MEWPKLIPTAEEIEETLEEKPDGLDRLDTRILSFEVYGLCAAHLNRLREDAILAHGSNYSI